MSEREKFRVITNPNYDDNAETAYRTSVRREQSRIYHSNPLREQYADYIREKFVRYVNGEAGRRFSVEDLFNLC